MLSRTQADATIWSQTQVVVEAVTEVAEFQTAEHPTR
jgi:hypothetical protein